jgi:hypothetical protein
MNYPAPGAADATSTSYFKVSYLNPPVLNSSFWYAWQTMLIVVLVILGGPVWIWRVLLYMRQRSNQPMDLELLVFGCLAAIDTFSAALCFVLFLVSMHADNGLK